jgi:DNA-binding NtrC family response regulator
MPETGKILIVDDHEDILHAAKLFLKRHFQRVDVEANPEHISYLVNNNDYDVILLDMNFTREVSGGSEGFLWLNRILEIKPEAVVILITAYGDIEMAVKAMKEGATDFIIKPWENEKLLATLKAAIKLKSTQEEAKELRQQQKILQTDQDQPFHHIIGNSPAIQKVFAMINKIADTEANVLILGENGTGKELIARAIHRSSMRSDKIFVSVDMGAISENLFESELFGHIKGAFTDAKEDKPGRFEIADKGTIFLDEIGNLSLSLQAKLLTVLQSREVTRVGSNKPKKVNFRLISATNIPLVEMVEKNSFRQDLLYRLNTIELHLPPLRERIEDIPLLANHYLQFYNKKYKRNVKHLSPALLSKLEQYPWPGNIRELQHAMERAVIMCGQNNTLQVEDFFFTQPSDALPKEKANLDNLQIEEVEKILIQKALKKHNGNITHAASELGLTRASLYRRLEKYGL